MNKKGDGGLGASLQSLILVIFIVAIILFILVQKFGGANETINTVLPTADGCDGDAVNYKDYCPDIVESKSDRKSKDKDKIPDKCEKQRAVWECGPDAIEMYTNENEDIHPRKYFTENCHNTLMCKQVGKTELSLIKAAGLPGQLACQEKSFYGKDFNDQKRKDYLMAIYGKDPCILS